MEVIDPEAARKRKLEAKQKRKEDRARQAADRQARREARRRAKGSRPPSVLLKEIWNLPNMMTMARIALIPVFVYFIGDGDPLASVVAGLIFTLAAVTDIVDGWLARRWNMITVVGKLLDPLADKLIVAAAMVMMVWLGRLPAWIVIVLMSREFIVTGLRQVAASEGLVIAAGQEGKWKTALQLTGLVSLCIHYTHPVYLIFATFDVNFNAVGRVLVYFSTAFSVWSAGLYFRAFLQLLASRGGAPEKQG
jgi:CDP-diacylglycerol--glycerol-3-phosphate 3-phosphatidyltransferase